MDAPPHGGEFEYDNDDHKNGCPCLLDYKVILKSLKDKGIKYYMIPLNSSVNKCF